MFEGINETKDNIFAPKLNPKADFSWLNVILNERYRLRGNAEVERVHFDFVRFLLIKICALNQITKSYSRNQDLY